MQCKVDANMLTAFQWGMKQGVSLKHTFMETLQELCNKSKRKKLKTRIMARMDRQLHIRNMIAANVTIKMLL